MGFHKILLTAFEPYHNWSENSSQICAELVAKDASINQFVEVSIYPVDFELTKVKLLREIKKEYSVIIHTGQIETSSILTLERVASNYGSSVKGYDEDFNDKLIEDGEETLLTNFNIKYLNQLLSKNSISNAISTDAGSYLCNAIFYWSLYFSNVYNLNTKSIFIHIPLVERQVQNFENNFPYGDINISTAGLKILIKDLINSSL